MNSTLCGALFTLISLVFAIAVDAAEVHQSVTKHPDWSPSGDKITFEADFDGASNVYVAGVDGRDLKQLTFGSAMDSYPRFSPGGQTLVFLSRRHGNFSLLFVSIKGSTEREFLEVDGNLEPAFSPNGQKIVFRSYMDGNAEIMMANVDGSALTRLTNNEVEDGFPSFSNDGRSIFFHRTIGEHNQVFMMNLTDGSELQLTDGYFPSWHAHHSPDGRRIVYDAEKERDRNIFVMDLTTQKIVQLTDAPGRDGYPKWSPDGTEIAFHSARDGGTRVFLMDADGRNQRPYTLLRHGD